MRRLGVLTLLLGFLGLLGPACGDGPVRPGSEPHTTVWADTLAGGRLVVVWIDYDGDGAADALRGPCAPGAPCDQ